MNRRHFLAMASAGCLTRLSAQSGATACVATPGGESCPLPNLNMEPFHLSDAGKVENPPGEPIKRRLWSKLSAEEQIDFFHCLRTAYGSMVNYDPSDPRSPIFQAWLHRYYCSGHGDGGPVIIPGALRNVHHSSAFLPWHRAFLFFYERLIQRESGNHGFRLPVWDWDAPGGHTVPWIYDKLPFPKTACVCQGRQSTVPPLSKCLLTAWLQSNGFDDFVGTADDSGMAANGPHSTVHTKLSGYMSEITTAAMDPVFYAHHANVDRFWWDWWQQSNKLGTEFKEHWPDPSLPSSTYYFYDFLPEERPPHLVHVTAQELADIGALGYTYDPTGVTVATPHRILAIPSAPGVQQLLSFDARALMSLNQLSSFRLASIPKTATSLAQAAWNYASKISDIQFPDLGVRITIKLPNPQPGKYYYIAAVAGNSPPVVVGGFGTFVAHGGAARLSAVSCLTGQKLLQLWPLIRNSRKFSLVCAPAARLLLSDDIEKTELVNGKWQNVETVLFEIQLPAA